MANAPRRSIASRAACSTCAAAASATAPTLGSTRIFGISMPVRVGIPPRQIKAPTPAPPPQGIPTSREALQSRIPPECPPLFTSSCFMFHVFMFHPPPPPHNPTPLRPPPPSPPAPPPPPPPAPPPL